MKVPLRKKIFCVKCCTWPLYELYFLNTFILDIYFLTLFGICFDVSFMHSIFLRSGHSSAGDMRVQLPCWMVIDSRSNTNLSGPMAAGRSCCVSRDLRHFKPIYFLLPPQRLNLTPVRPVWGFLLIELICSSGRNLLDLIKALLTCSVWPWNPCLLHEESMLTAYAAV